MQIIFNFRIIPVFWLHAIRYAAHSAFYLVFMCHVSCCLHQLPSVLVSLCSFIHLYCINVLLSESACRDKGDVSSE